MINRNFFRGFYGLVLLIAIAGQALAARDWLGWPLLAAVAAVAGVEFGGVVLSMHADERRRLGEHALPARLLAAAVAAGAVALNWLGHADHLVGGFFAGMSGLGFSIWIIDSAARRRDALRAEGKLPPTPPVYGVVRWLRHPWLTHRARLLALKDPSLGLYGSLSAATAAVRSERRQAAIAAELRQMIAAAAGPTMATVAVNTFDMDAIAHRLAANADYDGLAARLAAQLTPAALTQAVTGELSQAGKVEPTGSGQLELSKASKLEGSGDRLPDEEQVSQVGHLNDGDLFELAATLTDLPHYPLPRTAAAVANGHNGAHVTAAAPATLAVTGAQVGAHDDAQNGDQVSATADHEPAATTLTSPLTEPLIPVPDPAHEDAQNDATPDTKVSAKTSAVVSGKKPTSNERKVAQALKRTPDATAADIARRTGIPAPTVRRLVAKLRDQADTPEGLAS